MTFLSMQLEEALNTMHLNLKEFTMTVGAMMIQMLSNQFFSCSLTLHLLICIGTMESLLNQLSTECWKQNTSFYLVIIELLFFFYFINFIVNSNPKRIMVILFNKHLVFLLTNTKKRKLYKKKE